MNACSPCQLFLFGSIPFGSILFGSILFGSILFGSFTTETLPNTCSVVCDVPHSSSYPVRCSRAQVIRGSGRRRRRVGRRSEGQRAGLTDHQQVRVWVDRSTVVRVPFEVVVRTTGVARRSDVADHVAAPDLAEVPERR